jgi:hypothetical protein
VKISYLYVRLCIGRLVALLFCLADLLLRLFALLLPFFFASLITSSTSLTTSPVSFFPMSRISAMEVIFVELRATRSNGGVGCGVV